jgi:hypothetical protein
VRTTETTITFRRPFTLSALDKAQPAGAYRVVTEEEEIDGLYLRGFPAHGDPGASPGAIGGKRHATGGQRRPVGMDRHRRSGRPKLGETQRFREKSLASRPKITTFQLSVASRTLGIRPPKTSPI